MPTGRSTVRSKPAPITFPCSIPCATRKVRCPYLFAIPIPRRLPDPRPQPSAYWGNEAIWTSKANVHNPMFDGEGRVWFTSRVRGGQPIRRSAARARLIRRRRLFRQQRNAGRHLAVYDPKTRKVTLIDTCFSTHHLQFAEDANNTLWTSSGGGGGIVGWLNTKMFLETGDEEKSQGWTPLILDTNGNGKRDAFVNPDSPPIRRKTLA